MSNSALGFDDDPGADKFVQTDLRSVLVGGVNKDLHVPFFVIADGTIDRVMAVDSNKGARPGKGATGSKGASTITTSDSSILAADGAFGRFAVWLVNSGAVRIWIAVGSAAVVGQGTFMDPDDRLIIDSSPNASIRGISTSGSVSVPYMIESL